MAATARARSFIYQTLTADSTLAALIGTRVHMGKVPAGGQLPAVIMRYVSGSYLRIVGPTRVWAEMMFDVKVVIKGTSTGPIEPIVNRIDDLLDAAAGAVNGATVEECTAIAPIELPVYEGGVDYVQLGNEYRLRVQES